MLQVNDFLLRLSLCRGIGLVSKYRLCLLYTSPSPRDA